MRLRPPAAGSCRPQAAILLSALTFPAGVQTDATPVELIEAMRAGGHVAFIRRAQTEHDYADQIDATMGDRLAPHLSAVPGGAMKTVLVGHDDPFDAAIGIHPEPKAVTFVLRPPGDGFEALGSIGPGAWPEQRRHPSCVARRQGLGLPAGTHQRMRRHDVWLLRPSGRVACRRHAADAQPVHHRPVAGSADRLAGFASGIGGPDPEGLR